jgi:flagellar hook-basal body complex protein FliE
MSRAAIFKIRGPFLIIWVMLVVLAAVPSHTQSDSNPPSGRAAESADDIIPFLNQTIVWSRQLSVQQQLVNEPSDALFMNDCRQIADQVVHQAFDFARARAQALANQADQGASSQPRQPSQSQTPQSQPSQPQPSQYQRLIDSLARADQKVKQSQKDVDDLRLQLASATEKKRRTLLVAIDEADSELELFKARRDALRNMLQFATGTTANGSSSGGLLSQVEELARTVPAAANAKEPAEPHTQANATTAAPQHKETPNGIFSLATDLLSLRQKLHALDASLHQTDLLAQTAKNLRTPLIARIRELTQKGDELSGQPESQDPAVLAQQRNDLDSLTAQFKQISASVLPLGKQNILLDVYKRTTTNWRNSVASQYQAEWKGLAIRLLGLAFILGVVLGISELWRRATFRYITDARRRYQFLLIAKCDSLHRRIFLFDRQVRRSHRRSGTDCGRDR